MDFREFPILIIQKFPPRENNAEGSVSRSLEDGNGDWSRLISVIIIRPAKVSYPWLRFFGSNIHCLWQARSPLIVLYVTSLQFTSSKYYIIFKMKTESAGHYIYSGSFILTKVLGRNTHSTVNEIEACNCYKLALQCTTSRYWSQNRNPA